LVRQRLQRVPGQAWVVLGAVLIFGVGFLAVVLPLLQTGGSNPRAEVAGVIPGHATVGQPLQVPVAYDNVSGSVISPVCIAASFDAPVTIQEVRFQGLDRVPFRDGRACGGRLSGQETVSVVLVLVFNDPGTVHARLGATQGALAIGPELTGTITVTR
jgi:hypothetical protein